MGHSFRGPEFSIVKTSLPRLFPDSSILHGRLPAVAGVAETSEVLGIVEGQPIAIVLRDVDLRPDDVVDVRRSVRALAHDAEPAERITGENERDCLLAPGRAIVEFLEPGLAANAIPVSALL